MITTLTPSERPLLQGHLDDIDKGCQAGFTKYNWKNTEVNKFIEDVQSRTQTVFTIFETMKGGVRKMRKLLREFSSVLLCERKNKPVSANEFGEALAKLRKSRYEVLREINGNIIEEKSKIHQSLSISLEDPKWKTYVAYVEGQIELELSASVKNNVDWFIKQVTPVNSSLFFLPFVSPRLLYLTVYRRMKKRTCLY